MKPIHAFMLLISFMLYCILVGYNEVLFKMTVVILLTAILLVIAMKGKDYEHL